MTKPEENVEAKRYRDGLRGLWEILYRHDVDQFDEELLELYDKKIKAEFGDGAVCDWRDEQTLWVWDPPVTVQDTVVISAAVTVSVTYCEADFETAEEYRQFYRSLTSEVAKQLLIDNLDVDDTKDNIAQLDRVDIEAITTEK